MHSVQHFCAYAIVVCLLGTASSVNSPLSPCYLLKVWYIEV